MNKFDALKAAAENRPHGTRARYISGCRCLPCRAANSRYSVSRDLARREGDLRELVSSQAARNHVWALSQKGVGYKTTAAAASVSNTVMAQIRSGYKKQIRRDTERRILAVDESARGDRSLIPAGPTWRKLDELLERGFSRAQLATWLGCKTPALQIRRDQITARTAANVERMCALLEQGRLHRDR